MPVIRIDERLYQVIKDYAEPLRDSPNTALMKMLGCEDPGEPRMSFQARLQRLGMALVANDHAQLTKELDIEASYRGGAFR